MYRLLAVPVRPSHNLSSGSIARARCRSLSTSCTRARHDRSTSLASLRPRKRQRLYLSGVNPFLPPRVRGASSSLFQEVQLGTWLASLGVSPPQRDEEIEISKLAVGYAHAMVAYKDKEGESIFAIGRGESGQLGIGYNSQEPTRGLVEGFQGDYVEDIKLGITSSYIQVRQGDRSVLYTCGNHSRGQIGLSPHDGTEPKQIMSSRAVPAPLPEDVSIRSLACGFEHALFLSEEGELFGTGVNTDGQLGTGAPVDVHAFTRIALPAEIEQEGIASVHAGADTSAVVTRQGKLWTFGNSEYAQAMHGRKIDQILQPTLVDPASIGDATVLDFRIAGSSSVLLNDRGEVYVAGFGALGLGKDKLETLSPTLLPAIPTDKRVKRIFAAHGAVAIVCSPAAANEGDEVLVFGLNTAAGRLGTGTAENAYEPTVIDLPTWKEGQAEVLDVGIGRETVYVLTEQDAGDAD